MKIYMYNGVAKILPSIGETGNIGEIIALDGELFNQEFPELNFFAVPNEIEFYEIISKTETSYTIQNIHANLNFVLDFETVGRHIYNAKKWSIYLNNQLQICKKATNADIIVIPQHLEFHLLEEQ